MPAKHANQTMALIFSMPPVQSPASMARIILPPMALAHPTTNSPAKNSPREIELIPTKAGSADVGCCACAEAVIGGSLLEAIKPVHVAVAIHHGRRTPLRCCINRAAGAWNWQIIGRLQSTPTE